MPYLVMIILTGTPGLPGLFFAAVCSGCLRLISAAILLSPHIKPRNPQPTNEQIKLLLPGNMNSLSMALHKNQAVNSVLNTPFLGLVHSSTVSSSINAMAAVTVEDMIKPYTNMSEKRLMWLSKGLSTSTRVVLIGQVFYCCHIYTSLILRLIFCFFSFFFFIYSGACRFCIWNVVYFDGWTFVYLGRNDAGGGHLHLTHRKDLTITNILNNTYQFNPNCFI